MTEVMVYSAEDLAGAGGRDAAGTDEDLGGAADPEGRAEASGAMAAGEVASTNPDEMGTAADGLTYEVISQASWGKRPASTGSGDCLPATRLGREAPICQPIRPGLGRYGTGCRDGEE